jgi:hypothetical protein
MANPMLQRVAKAIGEEMGLSWYDLGPDQQEMYGHLARAAIEAMHELDDNQIWVAWTTSVDLGAAIGVSEIQPVWSAIINETLSEE